MGIVHRNDQWPFIPGSEVERERAEGVRHMRRNVACGASGEAVIARVDRLGLEKKGCPLSYLCRQLRTVKDLAHYPEPQSAIEAGGSGLAVDCPGGREALGEGVK